jgi:hypothetical protein
MIRPFVLAQFNQRFSDFIIQSIAFLTQYSKRSKGVAVPVATPLVSCSVYE